MSTKQDLINESFKLVSILENTGDFIFKEAGLTVKTYSILYLISTGLDTSKDLLNGTYGSKPNMAKKLKFLEDNGFLIRYIDELDRRVFRFSITKKAIKAIEKITPIYEKSISKLFEGIGKKEIKITLEVIKSAIKNVGNCSKQKYSEI